MSAKANNPLQPTAPFSPLNASGGWRFNYSSSFSNAKRPETVGEI
jgi:hypothetical protein